MTETPATEPSATGSPSAVPRRRVRRMSQTRRLFLGAINAQITGTRVLAVVALLVLVGGGAYWLAGTTGSRLIGIYFIVLAAVLVITITLFIQLMRMFTGSR